MLRSLYSGVSGMKNLQTKMDVISNNIANTNTTGFKAGRVRFQDAISQTMSSAQGATNAGLGGVNARQIGLGVQTAGIDTIMTAGNLQSTGRDLDFAINGDGFFVLSGGGADQTKYYTRDGGFYKDSNGSIVNSSGLKVMGKVLNPMPENTGELPTTGWVDAPLTIPKQMGEPLSEFKSMAVDSTGKITANYENGKSYVVGQMSVATFTNADGLEKVGGNNYVQSNNSGEAMIGTAGTAGAGPIESGRLEMSNVDLANEFTEMIVASRAYQANSRSITTSDEMLQELINLKR